MAIKNTSKKNSGYILIEAFMAIMVISIAFATLLDLGALVVKTSTSIRFNEQANFFLKEELEAARSYRDSTTWATNGLGTVTTGSANPYYFSLPANAWVLQSGTETIGTMTRKIVFDRVSRDPGTPNIETVYNASHDDPNTRKATATVVSLNKTSQLITYFTNWK